MKPRILFVDQSGTLGGAELSLLDIAARCRDRCRVVTFADGPFPDRLRSDGVDTVVCRPPASVSAVRKRSGPLGPILAGPGLLAMAARLAKMAADYDVIVANTQKAMVVGAVAAMLARRRFIWHLRDMLTATHFSGANRRVAVTLVNRLSTRVIANSRATADAFAAAGGRVDRVAVVHNGIDATPFDAVDDAQAGVIRRLFGDPGAALVGVFGRLAPWKGQHVLIDALGELPGVRVAIVGEALFCEEDEAYRDRLFRQAEKQGLRDRVHFAGFRDDVAAWMRACDVVAHTSTAPEPFGRVIVEGMLASRPVVATDAGGAAEILTNGETGLLIPPGDSKVLASAIRRLLDDPPVAERLAEAGRHHAAEAFTVSAMFRAVDRVIDEACDRVVEVAGHTRSETTG